MLELLKDLINGIVNYDPEAAGTAKANAIAVFLAKFFTYVKGLMGIE